VWRLRGLLRETAVFAVWATVLAVAAFGAYFVLPDLVVSPSDLREDVPAPKGAEPPAAPTAVDLVQARNGARTAGVALIAALGAALATGFAARTFYLSRRAQLGERQKNAMEQLSSDTEHVRRAGVAELARIATDDAGRRTEIMQALAAFVCGLERDAKADAPPDMQLAFTTLVQQDEKEARGLIVDLKGADLRGVKATNARLVRADLRDTKLRGAWLMNCDLTGTDLTNAQAQAARFDGSTLERTVLEGAVLAGATPDRVVAPSALFDSANFDRTYVRGADLSESTGLVVRERPGAGPDPQAVERFIPGAVADAETLLPAAAP
jgi:uncharacterized protein YjbI with pentapeptide repeats